MKDRIPFNVDAGEGFQNEDLIFPFVDWCNISCGAHAGSLEKTENTILLAKKLNLKIGAHPSYPDKENFGRLAMNISESELKASLKNQLRLFISICEKYSLSIHHIKPHGALYHQVAQNETIAKLFFETLKELNLQLGVIGSPNSFFETCCTEYNLPFYAEAFADRQYTLDGTLKNRKENGAVLSSQSDINRQVLNILTKKKVFTEDGTPISIKADTICFHGDHKGSEEIIKNARQFIANELYH